MNKNILVDLATEELDNMTRDGFFGDDSAELLKKRDSITQNDFLYESLASIFKDNNIANVGVAGTSFRLIEFYCEAFPCYTQEVIDILTSFFNGTKSNPGLENMSSYLEYMTSHQKWKNYLNQNNGMVLGNTEKRQLAMSILSSYSKGVELIGKIFTQLIAICNIKRKEKYNIDKIAKMTIYDKINEFKRKSDKKYHILTEVIDRHIRNSDSHLNATYLPKDEEYYFKYTKLDGAIEICKISFMQMMLEIYPKIGMFIQGFYVSCIVIILNWSDRDLAQKAIKNIENINNGQRAEW